MLFRSVEKNITIDAFLRQDNFITLSRQIYNSHIRENKKSAVLEYSYSDDRLEFIKKVTIGRRASFDADYTFIKNHSLKNYDFGVEFNLFFLSPGDILLKSGRGKVDGKHSKVFTGCEYLDIVDRFKGMNVKFRFDKADVFTAPLYSVSSSESGFEKSYQQVTILFIKRTAGDTFRLSCALRKEV